jgi:hypothetical protein
VSCEKAHSLQIKTESLAAGDNGNRMDMKACSRCGLPQPLDSFSIRNRSRGTRQSICKSCQNEYVRRHYQAHRSAYIEKARTRNAEQSRINAEFLIEYLSSHPCVDCGESDIVVLEFDHQRDKLMAISQLSREGYSLERLKQEIAKCEVVCANCHRRRTAKQFGWYRTR